jgi:type VI secretion system secreted protein VgrG
MAFTQNERLISIDTPLGENKLLLQSFRGHEGISRLFEFQLELLSEDPAIAFNKIVGQRVTIKVALENDEVRYFNGFIPRFSQSGADARFSHYQAKMVPWLWFLTRTADCRIFQNMKVPDIIEKIFKDLGFQDYRLRLEGNYQAREYCVQYRETDFNFVSRLMEEYGIFYFFEHEDGKHTLVLGDSPSAHQPCPHQKAARCEFTPGSSEPEDIVTHWEMEQLYTSGKYCLTDYNFETPSTSLRVSVDSAVSVADNSKFEVYDFPGEYLKKGEGESLVRLRMEQEESQHSIANGASTCRAFTSGYRFDLKEHYRADLNKCYMLTEIEHFASVGDSYLGAGAGSGETYSNHFSCMPHSVPFRPLRVTPRPFVQGPQTAMVVGKSGEEIWTDKYGRVKVQFHWDREGKKNENSSCWIRVSHPWAGKGWGAVSIPRIGQEVVVDFIEGNPDLPFITGRTYNAEAMPPFGLPGGQVFSGIKSNSTKGGGGYNEFSMDDTKGKENITIHGQYNMGTVIEHDQTSTIHNNRTDRVDVDDSESVGGNQTADVIGNRTRTVKKSEMVTVALTRTHSVGGNEMINVGVSQQVTVGLMRVLSVGVNQTRTIGVSQTERVGKNDTKIVGVNASEKVGANQTINVGKNLTEKVGADQTVKIGKNLTENVGADQTVKIGKNLTENVGADQKLNVGKTLTYTVADQIVFKTGQSSITMKKDGTIIIKGKDITVDAMSKINEKAMNITSEASAKSVTKGSMVDVEASGVNTIKGSLVKIN